MSHSCVFMCNINEKPPPCLPYLNSSCWDPDSKRKFYAPYRPPFLYSLWHYMFYSSYPPPNSSSTKFPAPLSYSIGTYVGTAAPCVSYICYVIPVRIIIEEVGYDTALPFSLPLPQFNFLSYSLRWFCSSDWKTISCLSQTNSLWFVE